MDVTVILRNSRTFIRLTSSLYILLTELLQISNRFSECYSESLYLPNYNNNNKKKRWCQRWRGLHLYCSFSKEIRVDAVLTDLTGDLHENGAPYIISLFNSHKKTCKLNTECVLLNQFTQL